jgi:hypothetical protein
MGELAPGEDSHGIVRGLKRTGDKIAGFTGTANILIIRREGKTRSRECERCTHERARHSL